MVVHHPSKVARIGSIPTTRSTYLDTKKQNGRHQKVGGHKCY